MATELTANDLLDRPNGSATRNESPRVGGQTVSPPKRRDIESNAPTESFPALLISPKTRNVAYLLREVGLPYACVAGVFALLFLLGVYVLIPQNEQSIKNQESIQANAKMQSETNAKWATIVEVQLSRDARLQPAVENLTARFADLAEQVRGLRADFREAKK